MTDSTVEDMGALTDEDFLNQSESLETEISKVIDEEEEEVSSNENESSEVQDEGEEVTPTEEQDESEETQEEDDNNESEASTDEVDETPSDKPTVTKEDQLNAIYAPFKANGVDISVSSPEEAVRLMQQGAGASKRMQDLAPKLKLVQMLENNNLLDEVALNQLIALSSKDPKAIAAFLKEAEIDPFTLETDPEEKYTPKDYSVSDSEFKLKQTLNELSDQPKYQETLDIADSWDEKSQQMAINDPDILLSLNGHIQSGVYDQVANIVKQEMIKGNIANSTPFLEAYRYVGNQLQEAGAFDQSEPESGNEQTSDSTNVTTNNKGNAKLNSRRKSAGVTKASSPKTSDKPIKSNEALYKMSDDDFLKEFADEDWMNPQ